MELKENEYKCAECGEIFVKGVTDDEAEKEMKGIFGSNFSKEDCAIVCEDCWNKIMGIEVTIK